MTPTFDFAAGDLPSIEELSCFMAVVEGRSFAAAAKRLAIARSNVSRRMTQLEARLDARLLHRTTRSVELTEVGRAYYAEVREAMAKLQSASVCVHEIHARPTGRLRLSAPTDSAPMVAALIAGFCREYPDVEVETDLSQRRVDLVAEGFDVALRAGPMQDSSLIARTLTETRFGLFASPGYLEAHGTPSSVDELERHEFIVFGTRDNRQTIELTHTSGDERKLMVTGRCAVHDFAMMRQLLEHDLGIGYMPMMGPCGWTMPRGVGGSIVRVLDEWSSVPSKIHIVYPSARLVSAKLRAFCDFALTRRDTDPATTAPTCDE